MDLVILFSVSFLASRVLIRVHAHRALVRVLAGRARSGLGFCWGLMAVTALLSMVVPNVVTVLAMLPVIGTAVQGFGDDEPRRRAAITTLGLGVIYATCIGSMATLIGTPANGLLLAVLHYRDIPGRNLITPLTWSAVGAPFAIIFLTVAALVLARIERVALRFDPSTLVLPAPASRRDLQVGVALVALAAVGAAVLALWGPHWWVSGVAAALWTALVACWPLPSGAGRALRLLDLVAGLPWKGLGLFGLVLVLGVVVDRLGLVDRAVDGLAEWLPILGLAPAIALLTTATIFLTELMSNTAVAAAMWSLAEALARAGGYGALVPMIAIGLASNCAFMSPVATGATAVAFGGIPGLKLRRMLYVGAVINLVGAALISGCAIWVLAPLLG